MRKKSSLQKHKGHAAWLYGSLILAFAAILLVAQLGVLDYHFLESMDTIQSLILGRVSILIPLGLGLWGWHLLRGGRPWAFSLTTLSFLLVMVCFSGTAHQFFTPVGKELYPEYFAQGGGIIGGALFLAAHRLLGPTWTILLLVLLWLGSIVTVVPWRVFTKGWQSASEGLERLREQRRERQEEQQEAEAKQQSPAPFQSSYSRKQGGCSVYHQPEFSNFTEGIVKEKPIQRLLSFVSSGAYDEKEVKEQVKKDPVQIPNWQKESSLGLHPFRPEEPVEQSLEDPLADLLEQEPLRDQLSSLDREEVQPTRELEPQPQAAPVEEPPAETIKIVNSADKQNQAACGQTAGGAGSTDYRFPPLDILDTPQTPDYASYKKDIMQQCAILEQTLSDFKVHAKVIAVTRGPSVTRFELEPAPGVKVSSVVNLADDIALKLAAPGVRIEAPIPGKAAIGIEAPNIKNDPVFFREVVDNKVVQEGSSKLKVGLGKNISGDIIAVDLAKMPHLLVAGSTGSGKSVCINTIIAGLLYKASPDAVKLILVDPKVVELSNYNGIPHLLTPVVTDAKKAASALHWAVAEMERRYQQFADSHVREINSYNQQAAEKMPFIVIIIDELADLMMVAKVDVEDAILRLAQKARAAGIHLILATQRPSVDVITGIVKANIPSRISFAVSSQTDSRTILDMGGAEKLLGKGDMLFYPIGQNKPLRVQGAFVSDAELNRIVDYIVQQSIPVEYSDEVTSQSLECEGKEGTDKDEQDYEDELFEDALRLVMDLGQASSSMLQRRFRIGYTRAARLVDAMEALGIVGQAVGSKPREVILSREEIEARFLRHV